MLGYRLDQIENIVERIEGVVSGTGTTDRKRLADVYESCLAVDGYFPMRPLGMKKHEVTVLRSKTCNYCPSKIKPAAMKVYVEDAKGVLREYKATLDQFLKDNPRQEPEDGAEPTSVHDLGSTI